MTSVCDEFHQEQSRLGLKEKGDRGGNLYTFMTANLIIFIDFSTFYIIGEVR